MADEDKLSLEDLQALLQLHKKLVDTKDPRAEQVKDVLLSHMPPARFEDLGARGRETIPALADPSSSWLSTIGRNIGSFGNVMGEFAGQAPTAMMNFLTGHPMEQMAQREREIEAQKNAAYQRGDYSTGIGLGLSKSIPGSGDEGVAAGQAFGEGDIGGGMAHSLLALTPFFLKPADIGRLRSPVTVGDPLLPRLPELVRKFKEEGVPLHIPLKEAASYWVLRQGSRMPKVRSPITPRPPLPRVPEWQKPGTITEKTKRVVPDFFPQQGPMGMDVEGNLVPGELPSGRRPGPAPIKPGEVREPRVPLPEQYGAEPSPRPVTEFESIPGGLPSGRTVGTGEPRTPTPPPSRVSLPQQAGTQRTPRTVQEFSGAQGVTLPSGRKVGTGIPKPPGLPELTEEAIQEQINKFTTEQAEAERAAKQAIPPPAAVAKPKPITLEEALAQEHTDWEPHYGSQEALKDEGFRVQQKRAREKDYRFADYLKKQGVTPEDWAGLTKEQADEWVTKRNASLGVRPNGKGGIKPFGAGSRDAATGMDYVGRALRRLYGE